MKKKIEKKTNNISTVNEEEANEITRIRQENIAWNSVAERLKAYALRPDSISIYRFYLTEEIPKPAFYEAIKKYPKMAEAYEYAMEYMGTNREAKCDTKNLTESHMIAKPMWQFLELYHIDLKERAKLKAQVAEAQKPAVINYYSKPIPEEDEKK